MLVSNTSIRPFLADHPGADLVNELMVRQSLETVYGGPWKTTLNTDLFIVIWKRIFAERLHLGYDFTVKVDADTAFVPDRLRSIVPWGPDRRDDPSNHVKVYLNSCHWCIIKFIGPIEVVSRAALQHLQANMGRCQAHVEYHDVSEDVFLERCFAMLGIPAKNPKGKFLVPTWKVRNQNPKVCLDGWTAAHPLKDTDVMLTCYENMFNKLI